MASVATGRRLASVGGHTCVLSPSGSASCFGDGTSGQLGQGVYQSEPSPVAVSGGLTFVSIVAGWSHTCALEASTGDVYCWGDVSWGRLGDGSVASSGTTNAPSTKVIGGHSFVELTGGTRHTCGLTGTGDVYCWGFGRSGELGNNSATDSGTPVLVSGGNTYTSISAGFAYTCALTVTGSAHCWGSNGLGQLGDGTNTDSSVPVAVAGGTAFTKIEAGSLTTCALDATGSAHCWGYRGALGNGQSAVNSNTPQPVSGAEVFTSIAGGEGSHFCAIRSAAGTMCWGENWQGQLGDGTFTRRDQPTTVSGGQSFIDLAIGRSHTCGVTTGGSLYCWGDNVDGQLGLGFGSGSATPVLVTGGLTFVTP